MSGLDAARVAPLASALPSGIVVLAACVHAWRDSGSIAAAGTHGWIPYALLTALVLATVLASGAAARPPRHAALAAVLLLALAVWATISLAWSPVPSLARDEGLLTAFYATALAVPILSLRAPEHRVAALGLCVAILGAFVMLVATRVAFGGDVAARFAGGRLYFPITYANAEGSLFALGFWPAILLAARRGHAQAGRVAAFAAGAAMLAGATLAQSKGTVLGLLVSSAVVLAVSPARLRLLVPAGLALVLDAAAFEALTAPFRTHTTSAMHHAGAAVLAVASVGVVVGAVYVLADDRIVLGEEARRRAARGVAAGAIAAAIVALAVSVVAVGNPASFVRRQWHSFKHLPQHPTGTTHLLTLGSNRYDFWRVAVDEFARHPVAGCGARCFGPEYLVHRRSGERPVRAHSLPLEALSEQGLIGFALLVASLGLLIGLLGRMTRGRGAPATAALGAGVCWLAQACVDWTWTFAAVTAPAFVLMGIGAARAGGVVPVRASRGAAALVVAAALVLLVPPWLSARLTERALARETSDTRAALRWARRLDPLSTAPLIARAQLASSGDDELRALRQAASMEPRVVSTQYFLGVVELNLGRKAEARAQLERALRLDPGNPSVLRALALARGQ